MAQALSQEETANIGTITSLLSAEFPDSAKVPDSRVLKALQENNNSVDLAYMELLEEQQRSSWEMSGKKAKPKHNQNNAPQSIPQSAPGRGRGGRVGTGRGDRPEGREGQRDGGYRENRGGDMRGNNMGGGRGGRGGMSGPRPPMGNRNIESQGSMPMSAPIQPNNEAPAKPAVPAPAAPAPAPAVRQDAPPVVTNQWSQGRPRTQEEIPKPVVQEKPPVSKPAPGPVWSGGQQSKPMPAQTQGGAPSEAAKPAMPAPSAQAAPAPVQPQGVSAAGAQGSISKPPQVSAAPAAAPAPASNFEGLGQMSQNLGQLSLSDGSNGMGGSQQQAMHKSPQKGGMSDAAAPPGISQPDPMAAHDAYSAQFSAPNVASTQQQGGYAGQAPGGAGGLSHFPYQQQQTPPMAGTGQQQADLYNDPSKLGGGYGQLDNTFGGMGGADKGGYGQGYNGGKGGYGKGAAGGQQGGAGGQMAMQQNWQQQQQQQQQQQKGQHKGANMSFGSNHPFAFNKPADQAPSAQPQGEGHAFSAPRDGPVPMQNQQTWGNQAMFQAQHLQHRQAPHPQHMAGFAAIHKQQQQHGFCGGDPLALAQVGTAPVHDPFASDWEDFTGAGSTNSTVGDDSLGSPMAPNRSFDSSMWAGGM